VRSGHLCSAETSIREAEAALRTAHPMSDVEEVLFRVWWEEQVALRRQEEAWPRWVLFLDWLNDRQLDALPKGKFGEAVRYVLNHQTALMRYLWCGFLDLDNNCAAREMKRVATGRKNYLFAGSDEGGKTAAVLYSFVSTCQRHELNAFIYLRDILSRLPTHPTERLVDLLPNKWRLRPPTETAASPPQLPPPTG
jgi:transposase